MSTIQTSDVASTRLQLKMLLIRPAYMANENTTTGQYNSASTISLVLQVSLECTPT